MCNRRWKHAQARYDGVLGGERGVDQRGCRRRQTGGSIITSLNLMPPEIRSSPGVLALRAEAVRIFERGTPTLH